MAVFKRSTNKHNTSQGNVKNSEHTNAEDPQDENMVQCAHCAIHLPRSEAFLIDGKVYCSKNHIPNQSTL